MDARLVVIWFLVWKFFGCTHLNPNQPNFNLLWLAGTKPPPKTQPLKEGQKKKKKKIDLQLLCNPTTHSAMMVEPF